MPLSLPSRRWQHKGLCLVSEKQGQAQKIGKSNLSIKQVVTGGILCAALVLGGIYYYDHRPLHRIPSRVEPHGGHIALLALGDQGTGDSWQKRVADAMELVAVKKQPLDMVLLLGDNFYMKGSLASDSREWLSRFERVYEGTHLANLPFYAILGNHDHGKFVEAELEYARKGMGSNRWRMQDRYYSQDFGVVDGRPLLRVVFLNTNVDTAGLETQANFILKQFSEQSPQPLWRMVVGHHPLRTYGRHYGETAGIEAQLMPMLKRCRIDFYLSGHDHNLQVISNKGEPFLFVSGAGGGELYPITRQAPDIRFAKSTRGFMAFDLDASSASVAVHDASGALLASYAVDRRCGYGRPECLEVR